MEVNSLLIIFIWLSCILVISSDDQTRQVDYKIVEEVDPDELIGNVAESAGLEQQYGREVLLKLRFSILSDARSGGDFFRITESSGALWTAKKLDRDVLCPFSVECSISLDIMIQPAKFIQIIKVIVNIEDVNDNSPAFPQACKNLAIPESSVPGTTFSLPIADDKDSPKYGIQSYKLLDATDLFNLKITQDADKEMTLKLILNSKLDRERGDRYEFLLIATDGGTPQRTGTLHINITVTDINDNSPKFNSSLYTATVPENLKKGSVVAQVFAMDRDAGANGQIVYHFELRTNEIYQHLFGIDPYTGKIFLKRKLDFESSSSHHLIVEARDKGSTPLTDTTKVKINVTDVNDHPPLIKLHTLNPGSSIATITENQEVGFVAHVAVTDPDGGDNGKFSCSLRDSYFIMRHMSHPSNGEYEILSTIVLDREERSSYNLTIQCEDRGNPPLSSSILVPVRVTDQNDNSPRFVGAPYKASIQENNYVGATILKVTAIDRDENENGLISYHMDGDNYDTLHIDENSGLITAKAVFDYEQTNLYYFTVIARDKGKEPRSAEIKVSLAVIDTNDEAPRFMQVKYAFGVKENQPPGTSVSQVSAIDRDSAPFSEFVYSLDHLSKGSDAFRIDSLTGKITTKKVLDREQQSSYHIVAIATDRGDPPLSSSASIIVYIGDTNDNRPIIDFPNKYNCTVEVSTKLPVGHKIVKVRAHDDDVGTSAKLTYHLRKTPHHQLFRMETWSGDLYLQKQLPSVKVKVSYRLEVEVRDGGEIPLKTKEDLIVVFDNSIEYVPTHQPAKVTLFSARNLLLLTCVAAFALVVIFILLTVLVCLRRRNHGYRPPDKYRVTAGSEYPVYANIRGCDTLPINGSEPFILTNDSLQRKMSSVCHESPVRCPVSTPATIQKNRRTSDQVSITGTTCFSF